MIYFPFISGSGRVRVEVFWVLVGCEFNYVGFRSGCGSPKVILRVRAGLRVQEIVRRVRVVCGLTSNGNFGFGSDTCSVIMIAVFLGYWISFYFTLKAPNLFGESRIFRILNFYLNYYFYPGGLFCENRGFWKNSMKILIKFLKWIIFNAFQTRYFNRIISAEFCRCIQ